MAEKIITPQDIDWAEMEHVGCGGMVFENHVHGTGERRFWCMNCGYTLVLYVEEEHGYRE